MRLPAIISLAIAATAIFAAASPSGDWCEPLKASTSLLYEDEENPYIQSFKIGNRFHWQTYYVSGEDQAGNSFHHSGNEFRRFSKGETDWHFQNYDRSILTKKSFFASQSEKI